MKTTSSQPFRRGELGKHIAFEPDISHAQRPLRKALADAVRSNSGRVIRIAATCLMGLALALSAGCNRAAGVAANISGSPATSQVIARVHFAGMQHVNADANGVVFQEIWSQPATAVLRKEALDKLAAASVSAFQAKANQPRATCATLIRPLLEDFYAAEWFSEIIEHPTQRLECVWTLRLDENRAQLWQKNWAQLLSGWELKTGAAKDRLSFIGTNGWVAVHWVSAGKESAAGQPAENEIFRKLKQGQRPVSEAKGHWLEGEADLPRLAEWTGWRGWNGLPRADFTVVGRKEYLRTQARLSFREPMAARVERWQIPIETIRDPLISFTAIQGLASWLKQKPLIQELDLKTVPSQLFLWNQTFTPFQIQGAVPLPEPTNVFERILARWVPKFNRTLTEYGVGEMLRLTNRVEMIWRGLPILVPYLHPARDGGKGFLHAGIFPVEDPPKDPPPPQLFQRLNSQTNLLYYDWEITQGRLNQLRPLLQLAAVLVTVSPMSTNSTAFQWLDMIEPRLGNTVTEVAQVSPRELNLTRTSHLGLNGLELLTLANWLEGTNFPHSNLEIGFRPVPKPSRSREKR